MSIYEYDLKIIDKVLQDGRPVQVAVDHTARTIFVERALWNVPKVLLIAALPTLAPTTHRMPPAISGDDSGYLDRRRDLNRPHRHARRSVRGIVKTT